jgi:hypothetical protein
MIAKFAKKHKAALIAVIGIWVFWITMIRGVGFESYRDAKVSAGEVRRLWDIVAAHISRPTYLSVGGRVYHRVRGVAPYYLEVPGTNSILFVTQTPDDHITYHIFNLKTKEDIQIDGDHSGFGGSIGAAKSPGYRFGDRIESADTTRMTISTRTEGCKETMILNLNTKREEQLETLRYDAHGQVTNRSVKMSPMM